MNSKFAIIILELKIKKKEDIRYEYLNSVLFITDDNNVTDEIISAVTNHTPFETDWYGGIVSVNVVTAFQDRIDVEISSNEGEHIEIFVFQELDVIEE